MAQNQTINTPRAGEQAVGITTITPSVNTGQDYSPWRDDDLNNMVQSCYLPANFQYVDVTLQLQQTTQLTRLSLFDWQGVFTAAPATIYAQYNGQRTLIGTFVGDTYNVYVNMPVTGTVLADAIVIHKYCNNIPVKLKVFGTASTPPAAATISFSTLPARTVGTAPFALTASSTNTTTPITYSSSAPGVVSVSAATGQWLATVVGAGSATITASQVASSSYQAASASQVQVVAAAPVITSTSTTSGKIPIDGTRWFSISNAPNNILGLFDGSTTTGFIEHWGRIIPLYDAYYMLQPGEAISLESIRFYDGGSNNLNDPMTLSVLTASGQRVPVATYSGGHYGQWVGPNPSQLTTFRLPATVSNIKALILTATWGYPTEIELYGSYTAGTPLPTVNQAALAVQKKTKLRQQFGVNAFEWNLESPFHPEVINEAGMAAAKNFTGIRHYMDWHKLESNEGQYTYNPTHSGGWNYDAMYQRCKAEGIEVLACLKTQPDWLMATYPAADRDAENVPVRYGKDFTDPNSYLEQAKVAFQYAARYGANPNVNPALVRVDPTSRWTSDPVNVVKIGLNYIKYIECDNERDKWWKGRKAYQTAFEYAANMSAFYDGNKNTMGAGVGVKNADPSMQVVIGGLASPNPDYVRGMIEWCKQYRGYRADGSVNLCWDVINYHLYSNDDNTSQSGYGTRGAAPEVSTAGQTAQDFIKMSHQYAADLPVWVTETGFDINQNSPFHAIAIGSKSVLQVQADWTLRTALLHARWGIERTFFYQFNDDYPNNPVQFGSMGLINADLTPKPAADFLRQTNALLGNYIYTGTLNGDPIVDRYEANGKTIYALVVPDEKGRTATYTLDLGTADSARIYQPQAGQAAMSRTRLRTQNGKITLTVTETPQFVLAGGGVAITSAPVGCSGTGSVQWEQWTNVAGVDVSSIPTQTTPNATATLTQLESGHNIGDYYGARIRGYLCPPQSGNYVFRISGDDYCQLWLSSTDQPASKVLLASVTGYTDYRQWNKYPSQQSVSVPLLAGQRYYFEVLHKEAAGEDNVSVAWTLPNGTVEAPIAGAHLMPYQLGSARPAATTTASKATSATDAAALGEPELTIYPTPFTDQSKVEFALPTSGPVTLSVYDASGRLMQRLLDGVAEAGVRQQIILQGSKLAAGIYTVQLATGNTLITKKLVKID